MAPAPFVTKKAPAAKTTLLKLVRITSSTGILAIVPVSLTLSKSGVSAILSRINKPTATSTILSRKGILQPKARKPVVGKHLLATKSIAEMTKDDATNRTCSKTDPEGGEGRQLGRQR